MVEMDYRDALVDAVAEETGAAVEIGGTGGNCEAMFVGLPDGVQLFVTDGDAGFPVGPEEEGGWLVQRFPHPPCGECDVCDDPPYVLGPEGVFTAETLIETVRRALAGEEEEER